ncbi:hypothetical protein HNR46_004242 [Haloferula luteola]|uniref:Uncharacterized protein n=1 Tax=Haloferula luteola TaxID=595692 RepID=A0A840VMY0_9BACT|nr:hypothetical protein [Haloferula luteola]MBB5353971.1 hypothetical protein [Haloferula luteola]
MNNNLNCIVAALIFGVICCYGHEGAEYLPAVREALKKGNLPDGVSKGKDLEFEVLTLSSKVTRNTRIEAHRGHQGWNEGKELFPHKVAAITGHLGLKDVPDTQKEIKCFTDGHIYKVSTKIVEIMIPSSARKFQIRVDSRISDKLVYESNLDKSWVMLRNVFADSAFIIVNEEKVFVPCAVCLNSQEGLQITTPFRSYESEGLNDFFDGEVSWRWYGENYLIAQLLVTEDKFGMNSIKERRVYLFNVSKGKLHNVDIGVLTGDDFGLDKNTEIDFDAEPIRITVIPARLSLTDSTEKNLLMRLKPKE